MGSWEQRTRRITLRDHGSADILKQKDCDLRMLSSVNTSPPVRLLCAPNQCSYRILYPILSNHVWWNPSSRAQGCDVDDWDPRFTSASYQKGSQRYHRSSLFRLIFSLGTASALFFSVIQERLPGETAPFQLPSNEQNTVYTYAVERRQRRQRQHSLIRANWRHTPDHPLAAQLIRESHQESDGSRVAV
jgi:hypothetical protein